MRELPWVWGRFPTESRSKSPRYLQLDPEAELAMHDEWLRANHPRFTKIRRDLHQHPELEFSKYRTSAFVAQKLARFGYEVTTGIAKTGVVGSLKRGNGNRAIAIRADGACLLRDRTEPGLHGCRDIDDPLFDRLVYITDCP